MAAMLVADRFLRRRNVWIDIATADAVTLVVHPAGPPSDQIAWAERCAMLSRLRHPAINPLVDFGAAGSTSLFEAYAVRRPLLTSRSGYASVLQHAERFLDAHAVAIADPPAVHVIRSMQRAAGAPRTPPVGIVLQPRRAVDALSELLATSPRGGVTTVTAAGASGAGLRTLRTLLAHAARREGYLPVCPAALARWPELLGELEGRHVCVLLSEGVLSAERAALAVLLTRLARRSARPHICLTIERAERPPRGAIHLEPMGITTMTTMLYIDPDDGPSVASVFDAARRSDGLPGRFLHQLGAHAFEPIVPSSFAVHEASAPYQPDVELPNPNSPPRTRSRIGSVVSRAGDRASALESRGRHTPARRLLERAARILEGRGEGSEAAQYWRRLAWMARRRGDPGRAIDHAASASRADPSPEGAADGALITSICLTDTRRFVEAEASLRNLAVAAGALDNPRLQSRCLLALGRALTWQGQGEDALTTLAPLTIEGADLQILCEAAILRSRAHLLLHASVSALAAAREAAAHAASLTDERLRANAHRATAEALAAVGDVDGVRRQVAAGLAAARRAHLPLAGLRLRAVLLRVLQHDHASSAEAARLRVDLERALRRPLPALVRSVLEESCRRAGTSAAAPAPRIVYVEHLLEIAHRAADDRSAVSDVLAALCEQVRAASIAVVAADMRVLIAAGRPWRDAPTAARHALASGQPVMLDVVMPHEAGAPIRYGGEVIAAIGSRWLAGTTAPAQTTEQLRAAAMAIATHVRALLDVPTIDGAQSAAFGDLLGESAGAASLRESVARASRAPFAVLIEGESGSGKELVARAIHRLSPRHTRRFCTINCAALTDDLVEAELFGHARGAFTGATTERAGLFEEADGGTLFLDEVGELSARAQAKLLRVLQEGEVRRVGENLPRRVDVRIVAATNRRLEQEAADGRFRMDLRFRLDVLRIVVPPLRDRAADIPLLAQHFWRQAATRVNSQATLGPDALAALARHDWPGNVRELQNVIACMVVHAPRRGRVGARQLPAHLASTPIAGNSFEVARAEFERRFVRAALAQAGGHRQAAAKALGVSRQGLAKMLRRLQIEGN
jgi:DNA-binding NtrC family response regulator